MDVEIKHKHQFIILISIAIILAIFGFTILHVATDTRMFYRSLKFFAWEIPYMAVIDTGFACLGAALVITLFALLELAINTKSMIKIRKTDNR